jgi:hypothetical protein
VFRRQLSYAIASSSCRFRASAEVDFRAASSAEVSAQDNRVRLHRPYASGTKNLRRSLSGIALIYSRIRSGSEIIAELQRVLSEIPVQLRELQPKA